MRNSLMRLLVVTEDCLPHGHKRTYVRIRGQFWGRAAPAPVILDKNPGALIFVPAFRPVPAGEVQGGVSRSGGFRIYKFG
jgi:hypothetical protein